MNKRAKIVVNAMVGNESQTITRMLESVAPHISYYVIQCNGNDDTQQIIEKFFNERAIPGFTYNVEWNFPGWNRDHALQKCLQTNHECDWILRMDADERLQVDDDFDWSILNDTSIASYNITAQAGATRYFRTWFWNAKLPWFFQHDKRHETIHLPEVGESFVRINMPFGFRHLVSQDGNTWLAPRKFLRDALELEIDKVVGDTVLQDPYHLWYIAKSYADCYGNPNELAFGKKHSDEYARRAIWYYQRFFESVHNWDVTKPVEVYDEMGYFALITMGNAYSFMGENDEATKHFKLAGQFASNRNEHFVYLLLHLEKINEIEEAISIIDKALSPERINPFPHSSFLIEDRAYGNTSNFLVEYREKLLRKTEEHTVDMSSVKFDFN